MEEISDGLVMLTLSFREEHLELGKDFFVWSYPTHSGKAVFMVDGVVKRTVGEAASRSHEDVR